MITKLNPAKVLTALMVAHYLPLNVMAFDIGSKTKDSNFSAPVYAKLGKSDNGTANDTIQSTPDLSPVKLDQSANAVPTPPESASQASIAVNNDAGALNASVEEEKFVPKPPAELTDSLVGKEPVTSAKERKRKAKSEANEKALHEAANQVGPPELQPTDREVHDKVATILDAEKTELAELWDAALCRSQDIQFVVQKLMPTKDPSHSTAVMMKMLSAAMYGGAAAGGMMNNSVGGPGGMMLQSAGTSLVMSVFNQIGANTRTKVAVTQTEAIMLYKMIRDVSREVSHDFHEYKKNVHQVARGYSDYDDLSKMVADARSGQDTPTQLQMEFLLRKNRRELDGLNEDARNSRDALVTLTGSDAVDNLDKEIGIENEKTGQPQMPQEKLATDEKTDGKVDDDATNVDSKEAKQRKISGKSDRPL